MTTMIIPPNELRMALAAALTALQKGKSVTLSVADRQQLQKVIASACHGPVALEQFSVQLAEAKGAAGAHGSRLGLNDLPAAALLKDGLDVLSDEQLARLATSVETIRELNTEVGRALQTGELGEFWWEAYAVPESAIPPGYLDNQAMQRALDAIGPEPTNLASSTTPAAPAAPKPRGWRAVAGPIGALAACLLVGVFIGWYIHGNGQDRREVLVASAKVEPSLIRGPNDEKLQQLRVAGPFEGFVVVLALAPDRKQRVIPEFGADDKPVAAGADSEGIPVPADTTRAIFVVTETPAGEPIRRAFEGKTARRFSPDQEAELRRELEDFLKKKGYRRIAIGSATVVPNP